MSQRKLRLHDLRDSFFLGDTKKRFPLANEVTRKERPDIADHELHVVSLATNEMND